MGGASDNRAGSEPGPEASLQRDDGRRSGGVARRGALVLLLAVAVLIGSACERSSIETGGGTPLESTAISEVVEVVEPPPPTPIASSAAIPLEVEAPPAPTPTAATVPVQTKVPEGLPEAVTDLVADAVEMATADLVGRGDADRA